MSSPTAIQKSKPIFSMIGGSFILLTFVFSLIIPQIAGATIYQPGETLEPDCAPGSANCGVAIFKLNGSSGSSQSLLTGTTGTDFSISSSSNNHYFNLPSASALARGLLTASDWSIFNSKQSALGYTPLNSANNLSDVASSSLARTNLGLGSLATQNGTFSGTHSGTSSGTNTGDQTTITGNAGTATALQTARTIGGVSFDGTANITVATATGGLTVSGGNLALGANSLTMTGSLGSTGARLTKGWFTDLESTNAITGSITGNAATVTTNANLTGAITSVGNATSLGSFSSSNLSGALTDETGSGLSVFATSPTLVTPVLGAATATSINGNTITTGTGTLTLGASKTLTVSDSTTLATNAITLGGGEVITFSASNGLSLLTTDTTSITLPTSGTLYGTATGSITSANLSSSLSDETGSGLVVLGTAPTFASTVTIGTAGGTTGAINLKGTTSGTVTLTTAAAAGTYTLTLPTDDGTVSQFLQTNGSGVLTWTSISGGGDALVANPLSQFATTTSVQLAGVISDETGSGALVFGTSPVFTTPNIGSATGSITGNAGTATALQTARTIGGVSFDGTANITVTSATGGFTVSGALAANGGITFDSATDTVGAHTLSGTLDASTQIITNIGNIGTDFVATTGALTLAGILTANGGISIDGNALTGTTGNIDYTNFDVIGSSGNTDIGGTITAGSSNTAVTLATGMVDADSLTLTSAADGGSGTSSGSGLEARSDGIGLLQGCTDTQVLKWVESTDTWDCGSSQYSKFVSTTSTSVVALTDQGADIAGTDVDVTTQTSSTATHVLLGIHLEFGATLAVDAEWTVHAMPDGTAVGQSNEVVGITMGDSLNDSEAFGTAIVALTAGQVFDYGLDEITAATTTATFTIYVQGYWQPVTTGADLAEYYYTKDESIQPGDVVSLDLSYPGGIKKSEGKYDEHVLGVISTAPGMVLGDIPTPSGGVKVLSEEEAKNLTERVPLPVALVGRVPVNVSIENGPIIAGDYLTPSSTPGVAMKATKSGKIIGQALFAHDKEEIGAVMMFIKNFDFGENTLLLGDISKTDGLTTLIATIQSETAHDPIAIIAKKITAGKEFLTDFIVARVTAIRGYFDEVFAKKVHTEQLCVKKSDGSEVCVNGDQINSLLQDSNVPSSTSTPIQPSATPEQTPAPTTTPETVAPQTNEPVPAETPPPTEAAPPMEVSTPEPIPPPMEPSASPAPVESQ